MAFMEKIIMRNFNTEIQKPRITFMNKNPQNEIEFSIARQIQGDHLELIASLALLKKGYDQRNSLKPKDEEARLIYQTSLQKLQKWFGVDSSKTENEINENTKERVYSVNLKKIYMKCNLGYINYNVQDKDSADKDYMTSTVTDTLEKTVIQIYPKYLKKMGESLFFYKDENDSASRFQISIHELCHCCLHIPDPRGVDYGRTEAKNEAKTHNIVSDTHDLKKDIYKASIRPENIGFFHESVMAFPRS